MTSLRLRAEAHCPRASVRQREDEPGLCKRHRGDSVSRTQLNDDRCPGPARIQGGSPLFNHCNVLAVCRHQHRLRIPTPRLPQEPVLRPVSDLEAVATRWQLIHRRQHPEVESAVGGRCHLGTHPVARIRRRDRTDDPKHQYEHPAHRETSNAHLHSTWINSPHLARSAVVMQRPCRLVRSADASEPESLDAGLPVANDPEAGVEARSMQLPRSASGRPPPLRQSIQSDGST